MNMTAGFTFTQLATSLQELRVPGETLMTEFRTLHTARTPQALHAAIEIDHVVKIFGSGAAAFTALSDVSITIKPNEFFTLLGPSGCGKTTLLRLIAGFEFATQGSIRLDGSDIAQLPPYRRPVNTVFQNYALFPHMSVAQNIAFGLQMLGRSRKEIDARVSEVLALVRMTELKDRATSEISGGQQQRVALARALAPSPKVLLLDEPLSALDFKLRKEMQIELKRMQLETGITFVFVTHDQEEALSMSDRIAVMSGGQVLQTGSPKDIYERPANRFVASFIGDTNFLDGTVESMQDNDEAAVIMLDCGVRIIAECTPASSARDRCTVVVRPEHLQLNQGAGQTGKDDGMLHGHVTTSVYSGVDSHQHVTLSNDDLLLVRQQNLRSVAGSQLEEIRTGDSVSIRIAPHVARVLETN